MYLQSGLDHRIWLSWITLSDVYHVQQCAESNFFWEGNHMRDSSQSANTTGTLLGQLNMA